MPIRLPTLDDRRYADLLQEMLAQIPVYAPEWTDHNPSDPGITLLELFAWLAEGLLYRIDRVPEASTVRMLELLGAEFEAARPATVILRVCLASGEEAKLDAGTVVAAQPAAGQKQVNLPARLLFKTVEDVKLTADWPESLVKARQVAKASDKYLGRGTGRPHQTFRLDPAHLLVIPQEDTAGSEKWAPEVRVKDELWTYQKDLTHSRSDAKHFTVDARRGVIRFGSGTEADTRKLHGYEDKSGVKREGGAAPPEHAEIRVTYWHTRGNSGNTTGGLAYQLDPADAAISVMAVGDATGGKDPTSLQDAREAVYETINWPWRAITSKDFETLVLGRPELGIARAESLAEIDARGPGTGRTRVGAPEPRAEAAGEPRPGAGHVSLMTLPEEARDPLAKIEAPRSEDGRGPSVREAVFSANGDAVAVWARGGTGDSIWTWRAAKQGDEPERDGVVSQPTGVTPLPLPPDAEVTCLAISPDGRWLVHGVALGKAGMTMVPVVWDLDRLKRLEKAPAFDSEVTGIVFRPDGKQVILMAGNVAHRYNISARPYDGNGWPWSLNGKLTHGNGAVKSATYSPDGRLLATTADDNAVRLWGPAPDDLIATLRHDEPVKRVLITPDRAWVVTLSGDSTVLAWPVPSRRGGSVPVQLEKEAGADGMQALRRVTDIALRQGGRRLVVLGVVEREETDRQDGKAGKARDYSWRGDTFEIASGKVEGTRELEKHRVLLHRFSPDLQRLLLVYESDPLHAQLWDWDAGEALGVLHHDEEPREALFSPGGRHLATIAGEQEETCVRAWNTSGAGLEMQANLGTAARSGETRGLLGPGGKFLVTWQSAGPGASEQGAQAVVAQIWQAERLARVDAFLDERKLITTHHHVLGTRFVDAQVRASVVPLPRVKGDELRDRIRAALTTFFAALKKDHPWEYGRNVYLSEVYETIEKVPGVDHVATLSLYRRQETDTSSGLGTWRDAGGEIFVPANQLAHYVRLPMENEKAGPDWVEDIKVRRPGS